MNWNVCWAVCKRDMLRFNVEKSRWFGLVAQPILFWLLIGFGLQNRVSIGSQFVTQGNEQNYLKFFFPGAVVMTVLFTTMFSSISIVEDRNAGFLQSVLVTPNGRKSLLAGKVLGIIIFVLIQMFFVLVFSPIAGLSLLDANWGWFFLSVVLGTIGLCSLNLAFAWILNSVAAFHGIMGVLLFPMWILSGALFPNPGGVIGFLQSLNPLSYFVDAVRYSLGVSNNYNHFVFSMVSLLVFALLGYVIGVVVTSEKRLKVAHS
jgi:ABC-2 type transport system permease protein